MANKSHTGLYQTNCGQMVEVNYYFQLNPTEAALGIRVQFCVSVQGRCWKTVKHSVEDKIVRYLPDRAN